MKNKIEIEAASWLSIISLMLNYFPYAVYIFLIDYKGNNLSNILPLAIFFAFRRTALFMFRDLRKNANFLAWLGLINAAIGYFISIFGIFTPILFQIGAIFIGCSAALFPTSLNQSKRNVGTNQKKNKKSSNGFLKILKIFLIIAFYALLARFYIALSFLFMLVWTGVAMIGYKSLYGKLSITKKVKFNLKNLIFICILLIALFLMELGRSQDKGTIVERGIFLLIIFLIILILILIFDRKPHLTRASKNIYLQMMMYGVCAMFWVTYSAIFITVLYGANLFAWVFLAYIAGIILEKPLTKMVMKVSPFSTLTTNSFLMIVGILATFWLPTYFIGIFIIRIFANAQKRITIDEYEKETGSYEEVQYLSYYLTTLSAFLTQAIMWIALILCCSPEGFDNILHSITFHQIASHYSSNIELTHLVLAAFMIIFILITYIFSKKEKKINYS